MEAILATQKQLNLEELMADAGIERHRRKVNAMKRGGELTSVARGVLSYNLEKVSAHIQEWRDKAESGGAGRRHAVLPLFGDVSSDVLAYLACRVVILGIAQDQTLALIERTIGQAVEDEQWLAKFELENPGAYGWVARELQRRGIDKRHQKRYMFLRVAKYKGVNLDFWTPSQHILCGKVLVELFHQACPDLFGFSIRRDGQKTTKYIKALPRFEEILCDPDATKHIALPVFMPMVEEPLPWSKEQDGGYFTLPRTFVKRAEWIKEGSELDQLTLLQEADMDVVFEAVNALDATPFRINERMMEVISYAFETKEEIAGLPSREPRDLPDFPDDGDTNPDAKVAWKKQARNIHEYNERNMSKRIDVVMCLKTAKMLAQEPAIYMPNQLDFRGRVYQMPTSLQNQGPDYARALLEFAEGKHVDDVGMRWLMIHGANMYGFDKASLDARVDWTHQHRREILEAAQDPWNSVHWLDADKPFQYLAWCMDYAGVLEGKPSHCRVAMDGSCNGLQHLSAMLRDPVGARAVNLVSGHEPADIYQEVANWVIARLNEAEGVEREWAREFLKLGFDRSMTKRSVMVMPYGGKFNSTMKYVEEAFFKKTDNETPFGDDHSKAMKYLSQLVFDGTREIIKGGALVMKWLQNVASIASKEGVHLKWTTPSGFVAQQVYLRRKATIIRTILDGQVHKTTINSPLSKLDGRRAVSAISPNFVHSLDAAALQLTIVEAKRRGVTAFHMVHDDYGTHAQDTQTLYECLREVFVEMYENDVLGAFRDEVQKQVKATIPEPPKALGFDIRQVLESPYFFS